MSTTVYIPIVTTSYQKYDFISVCSGAFSSEKKAVGELIKYLVEFGHIPHESYLDSLVDMDFIEEDEEQEENIVSDIFKANLQTQEDFILYLCDHCDNMEDLENYISRFGDSYYKQAWKIQIVKSELFITTTVTII